MCQRTFGKDVRLLQAASQQLRFLQRETTERLKACHGPGYLLHGSREQRYGVSDVSRQRIRRPQGWRHQGEPGRILEIRLLQEAHRPFKQGEGPGQVTLAESEQTKPPQGHYEAPGATVRLGDPAPFFAEGDPFGEAPQLGMARGERGAEHSGELRETEALAAMHPVERRDGLPAVVYRSMIVTLSQ